MHLFLLAAGTGPNGGPSKKRGGGVEAIAAILAVALLLAILVIDRMLRR